MRRLTVLAFIFQLVIAGSAFGGNRPESICYGTTANGRLENGVQLPGKGNNYRAYSIILAGAGRTFVHSRVYDVVVNTYTSLEKSRPKSMFVYGETGWIIGGRFKPHKTHQNGLSVDFMVPVVDPEGNSVPLPTGPFNKYGYGIEFDKKGRYKDLTIDFEAMAAHIRALHVEARKAGIDIWRVIFDPRLQPYLYAAKNGKYIQRHIRIPAKKSWVRHDEHYHVDFKVPCQPL